MDQYGCGDVMLMENWDRTNQIILLDHHQFKYPHQDQEPQRGKLKKENFVGEIQISMLLILIMNYLHGGKMRGER